MYHRAIVYKKDKISYENCYVKKEKEAGILNAEKCSFFPAMFTPIRLNTRAFIVGTPFLLLQLIEMKSMWFNKTRTWEPNERE